MMQCWDLFNTAQTASWRYKVPVLILTISEKKTTTQKLENDATLKITQDIIVQNPVSVSSQLQIHDPLYCDSPPFY